MMTLKFTKIRDVKSPVRGTEEAAGIDFFVPNYNEQFLADFTAKNSLINYDIADDGSSMRFELKPGQRVLIPSGIKTWMDKGTALIAANKSGVASKKGLIFGAQVVDSDYAGEVHINVINTGDTSVRIETGDKLIQFIHTPIILSPLVEVTTEEYDNLQINSARGAGGFGSTGTK